MTCYLPVTGDRCFCCEHTLGASVHVLGDGLFLCGGCDRELQNRRAAWLAAESALDLTSPSHQQTKFRSSNTGPLSHFETNHPVFGITGPSSKGAQ